jgi:ankyrin repeat protein
MLTRSPSCYKPSSGGNAPLDRACLATLQSFLTRYRQQLDDIFAQLEVQHDGDIAIADLLNIDGLARSAAGKKLLKTGSASERSAQLSLAVHMDETSILKALLQSSDIDMNWREPARGYTALHYAVRKVALASIKLFLEAGAEIDAPAKTGLTPLHLSVRNPDLAAFKLLLDNEARLSKCDHNGRNVWRFAARCNNVAALKLLIESDTCDEITAKQEDHKRSSPLIQAVLSHSDGAVESLLGMKFDLNAPSGAGLTLTHYCSHLTPRLLQRLIDLRLDITRKDNSGWTALHWLAKTARSRDISLSSLATLLVEKGVDPIAVDKGANTALHVLLSKCSTAGRGFALLDHLASPGTINGLNMKGLSPIHAYLRPPKGHEVPTEEMLPRLIERGAEVDKLTASGTSCLVIFLDHWPAAKEDADILRFLVTHLPGLNPLAGHKYGAKALLWAFRTEDEDTIKLLIQKGADLRIAVESAGNVTAFEAICKQGINAGLFRVVIESAKTDDLVRLSRHTGTALIHELCVRESKSTPDHLRFLLDQGADVELLSRSGLTALMMAASAGKEQHASLLMASGASVNRTDNENWSCVEYAILGGNINILQEIIDRFSSEIDWARKSFSRAFSRGPDVPGCNLLHHAMYQDQILELLLGTNCRQNTNAGNANGETALHWAAGKGLMKSIKLLLLHGANVNAHDQWKQTPLHLASGVDVISELLKAGADTNAQDCDGNTPLHVAAEEGHSKTARILLEHGALQMSNGNGLMPEDVALLNGHHALNEIWRQHSSPEHGM